jgi:hypothetical protein
MKSCGRQDLLRFSVSSGQVSVFVSVTIFYYVKLAFTANLT